MSTASTLTLPEQIQQLPFSPELAAAVIADLCRNNEDFARQIRTNPLESIRQALEDQDQHSLLDGFRIEVHENRDDIWHLPLPQSGQERQHLLNERQLENIGGGSPTLLGIMVLSGVIAGVAFGLTLTGIAAGTLVGTNTV